jgi:polyisoprenoid-binding protein YceI
MLKKTLFAVLFLSAVVAAQVASPRPYPIDNNHSTIGFTIPIMDGLSKVSGKFTDFAVKLINDEKDITKSSVSVVIKAASINTGIPARDHELGTETFFDVVKYPEITFHSTRIEKKGKQLIAVGTFTMHGVSKEITLPFSITGTLKDPKDNTMNVGYAARMVLNRQDFGISWRHPAAANFVGDNVEIEINLITKAVDAN